MLITSRTNSRVKETRALLRAKERHASGCHIIQGEKLVAEAVQSGIEIKDVFVLEGHPFREGERVYRVTESVMEAMTDLDTPPAVLATAVTPDLALPHPYPEGLIVALDRLQDPGNLGSIIRTADAMGAAGVLVSADSADPYGPKALRAAMGSNYHVKIWIGSLVDELRSLRELGASLLAGHLKGAERFPEIGSRCVAVIGNEGRGVSGEAAEFCELIRLPMKGRAESLNASAAAAILLYELSKRMP